jgi:hypothetical protein
MFDQQWSRGPLDLSPQQIEAETGDDHETCRHRQPAIPGPSSLGAPLLKQYRTSLMTQPLERRATRAGRSRAAVDLERALGLEQQRSTTRALFRVGPEPLQRWVHVSSTGQLADALL